jgi:hypothetical protein
MRRVDLHMVGGHELPLTSDDLKILLSAAVQNQLVNGGDGPVVNWLLTVSAFNGRAQMWLSCTSPTDSCCGSNPFGVVDLYVLTSSDSASPLRIRRHRIKSMRSMRSSRHRSEILVLALPWVATMASAQRASVCGEAARR